MAPQHLIPGTCVFIIVLLFTIVYNLFLFIIYTHQYQLVPHDPPTPHCSHLRSVSVLLLFLHYFLFYQYTGAGNELAAGHWAQVDKNSNSNHNRVKRKQ